WNALLGRGQPLSVIYDLSAVARYGEPVHSAALRSLRARLGYCSKSDSVADFELRLERDGEWSAFLQAAKATLGKDWALAKDEHQAEDHFAHVLHALKPERYRGPTSWLEARSGVRAGSSVREAVDTIEAMLRQRAPEKTLFIVVDEVSQYVERDENRSLQLQSFVSELGQRLKGRAWLLATSQKRFEDAQGTDALGRLQDRFPKQLRVHLGPTNIREVLHE